MARAEIIHRDLFERLGSIKRQSQWLKAAEMLGFRVSAGGKHPYVIRDAANPNNGDFTSSVATIPSNLHKVINQKIFRQFLESPVSVRTGITEEAIWKALGML